MLQTCGQSEGVVQHQGEYGCIHLYGKDTATPPIPGFRDGEPLAFQIHGVPASAKPARTWTNGLTHHQVDLAVEGVRFDVYLPLMVAGN